MQITQIPITAIQPYKNNARDNSNAIDKVKASIEKFGFKVPLVIDENYVIVTGHTRYEALKKIYEETGDYAEIPCNIVPLSSDLVKEYRIVDNKISDLSKWDDDKLVLELKALDSVDDIIEDMDSDIISKLDNSFGSGIKHITEEDISNKEQELDKKYHDASSDFEEATLQTVRCAHCGEEFTMRKDDLK